jgi:hypothetical protein
MAQAILNRNNQPSRALLPRYYSVLSSESLALQEDVPYRGNIAMSTSKTVVLQKAFLFLKTERLFQKRWVSLSSIESALRLRYPFSNHYDFNKLMLSKSLGKLHPKIDSLQEPNGLGVYQCKMPAGNFSTIQDPMLAPPGMPTMYANNSKWSKLCKLDEKLLASYKKNAIK